MMSRVARRLMLLCSIGVGCGGSSGDVCTLDTDCASGFCKADGTCGPAPVDAAPSDGESDVDGTTSLCNPNHDGSITLAELPFIAGRMGTFRITTDASWNTAGMSNANGSRMWDLSVSLGGDTDRVMKLAPPSSQWWTEEFPSATYATELSVEADLRGVFKTASGAVTLLGVVSPNGGTYKTQLAYDPPAQIMALPLTAGATWSSTSSVSGVAQGVLVAYTEKYESRVDQVGTMKTPYGEFPVLRIATDLTRTSGITTLLTKRTFSWVAECFGPVANASGQDFASGTELTDIAEIRRLAP